MRNGDSARSLCTARIYVCISVCEREREGDGELAAGRNELYGAPVATDALFIAGVSLYFSGARCCCCCCCCSRRDRDRDWERAPAPRATFRIDSFPRSMIDSLSLSRSVEIRIAGPGMYIYTYLYLTALSASVFFLSLSLRFLPAAAPERFCALAGRLLRFGSATAASKRGRGIVRLRVCVYSVWHVCSTACVVFR